MKLIAISGYKGSGKDVAAEYLSKERGFTRLSFADSLKEMVAKQYKVPLHYFHEQSHKESALLQYPVVNTDDFTTAIHTLLKDEMVAIAGTSYWTPRGLCILEGSIKRSVQSSYWVQVVLDSINKLGEDAKVVIPDLRYKSEIAQILQSFPTATITRINRGIEVTTNDPSERDLDDQLFLSVLDNTKDYQHLYKQLDNLV